MFIANCKFCHEQPKVRNLDEETTDDGYSFILSHLCKNTHFKGFNDIRASDKQIIIEVWNSFHAIK